MYNDTVEGVAERRAERGQRDRIDCHGSRERVVQLLHIGDETIDCLRMQRHDIAFGIDQAQALCKADAVGLQLADLFDNGLRWLITLADRGNVAIDLGS